MSCIAIICAILGTCTLAAAKEKISADLVVYGKIFTSEKNKIVEAFAVKDGKFIYVGNKKGVEKFIKKGKTEIIDYTGKGLVMPTCGNGHAHYSIGHGIPKAGTMIDREDSVEKFLNEMLSEGYTMYIDGWGDYFYNDNFYEAAQQMDKAGDMHFILGVTYEIESWMNVDEALAKAVDAKKYTSAHVKPNWIKLFMDGTVETGTGFIDPLYPDGHQGIPNWEENELTELTRKANEKNLSMHVHAMGNKAVNRVINSYINGGKSEMRNTLIHVYNVFPADYKRMADNNIYVAASLIWHCADNETQAELLKTLPEGMNYKGYPMKFIFR